MSSMDGTSSSSSDAHQTTEGNLDETNNNPDLSTMDERQKRLFQIKMKMNQGRKANKVEVENEYRQLTDPKFGKMRHYENKYDKSLQKASADIEAAMDDDHRKKKTQSKEEALLNITANDSQRWQEKKDEKERNKATFGWHAFTSDATFRAYEKSLKHLPTKTADDEDLVDEENEQNVLSLEDKLLSGQKSGKSVPKAALERLGKRIEAREKEKEKFSRRRMHTDAGDVDYINEDNAKFNKRVKRSFDKYTVEIRQNLERGTAV
jgi:pre-mRNA-splicing factor SYF2